MSLAEFVVRIFMLCIGVSFLISAGAATALIASGVASIAYLFWPGILCATGFPALMLAFAPRGYYEEGEDE